MTPLLYFLTRLRGATVTVELKDGTKATGTVQRVDNEMNVYLLNASVTGKPPAELPSASLETHAAQVVAPWTERFSEPDASAMSRRNQPQQKAREYRIRGSTVRYIILPESLNLESALKETRKFSPRTRYQKERH
ncbi:Sm protein D1 [Cyanidioschyzon merolae strain 10D]|uniref:Sm protein D1 n=1 Tax=Cyanidioschyzon merolae (strain NIES-3377 / 10D) TaxID=280699 RepID=M1VFV3_CYAM1|nr:Sm protein D1 [Cyanidioschyzon merolae strain 10D]BAM79463.1 Sm protein D1 [Cyanidioschyzon merolae strain 10D]|eukprot:XP_005535749.1 Sm protein D1 [Cyanidioschyzon merolae strain 10D]